MDQTIKQVRIKYVGDARCGGELLYPQNQLYWKYSDSPPDRACHIFFLPKTNKTRPIELIEFSMKSNVFWNIISPGTPIDTREIFLYNISDVISNQFYLMDYEVYHMLDYNNQPCQPYHQDHDYQKDECIDASIFKSSMTLVNCTKPFLKNKNHICTDKELAKKANQAGWASWQKRDIDCPNPCKYLKASYTKGLQVKSKRKTISFFFPKSIKSFKAYYAYSLLSLIAEVGGYVGLVLGWSFYQLTHFMDMTKDSCKREFCHQN